MVLFAYCVQYHGAVCLQCAVSWRCLLTLCSIIELFAYPVEYNVTVCILCTLLWYCFHTVSSNIVVLAYNAHCRAVSAVFTFPTQNTLTRDREFHSLFTFHYRITQRIDLEGSFGLSLKVDPL